VQEDSLEDEAEVINLGFEAESSTLKFEPQEFRPSVMADYPLNYKFTSINV